MAAPKSPPLAPALQARLGATPVRSIESIEEVYEIGRVLGTGRYGKVVEGRHKESGEVRAVKIVDTSVLNEKAGEGLAHEREILRRVRHPNIIKLYEVVVAGSQICLALQIMDYDLHEYLKVNKRPRRGLLETEVRPIMSQILEALQHLHATGIVHRDIKPENILINDTKEVRLADFGLAKVATDMNTPVGTSYYMAPEIVRAIEMLGHKAMRVRSIDEVKYIDMWATGCVLYFLVSGRPPFLGAVDNRPKRMTLLRQMESGAPVNSERWSDTSTEVKDLVMALLSKDVSKRLTAMRAARHKWFTIGGGEGSGEGVSDQPGCVEEEELSKQDVSVHIAALQDEVERELCEGSSDSESDDDVPSGNAQAKNMRIKLPPKPAPKTCRK